MVSLIDSILDAQSGAPVKNPDFPNAPEGWTPNLAVKTARDEGLTLTDEHWEVTRALQAYFAGHTNGSINVRELHDALDEKFHDRGGIKHLYQLLPGGPVAQGCRIAGLNVPAGAIDKSFGSVK
jgi:TusE/DsrC/DsvC family sulfur relay protein